MKWPMVPLKDIAPPSVSATQLNLDDVVWHLNLDQIESNTGYIVNKQMAPVSQAGSSTFIFDQDNILYSKLRPYLNKVVRPREVGIATSELIPLRPRKDLLDADFLTYYLRSNAFLPFAKQCVAGVKMPRIIMAKFWEHRVPLPPISEQRRIIEILNQTDALRKKRSEADSKAERILPALFYKMFGDPATNPKKWREGKLADIILDTQYGLSVQSVGEVKGTPIIRMNNIDSSGFLKMQDLKYAVLNKKEIEQYSLKPGDLLFNRTNSRELVGKTGLWKGELDEAVFASYLIRICVNRSQILPEYVWAYMNTPFLKQILFERARRAIGMANINAQELRSLPIIIPDFNVQRIFAKRLFDLDYVGSHRNIASEKVDRLFDIIFHHAFSGALTAKWREVHLKELLIEVEQQTKILGKTSKIQK